MSERNREKKKQTHKNKKIKSMNKPTATQNEPNSFETNENYKWIALNKYRVHIFQIKSALNAQQQ